MFDSRLLDIINSTRSLETEASESFDELAISTDDFVSDLFDLDREGFLEC